MKLNHLLDSNFISTCVASPLLQNPGSVSYRPNVIGLCGTPLREIANLTLWFVPEGAQSAWTLQETHRNSTSYARDEARTSERLLDRQTP